MKTNLYFAKRENMIDLTTVILTFNEEKHIRRCISSLENIAFKICIVDSFSTDSTVEIAQSLGADIVQRKFLNYADQFQWALDNLNIDTQWVMRLDADEYLEPELVNELAQKLPSILPNVDGIYIRRKVFFMMQWIRHGGFYPHTVLRIWRKGKGRIERRWMDEHIVLPPNANSIICTEHLVDDNLKGTTFWIDKHNHYASREMADFFIHKYTLNQEDNALREMSADIQARLKRTVKEDIYNKLPLFFRAMFYFFYRYVLRFGFLDGGKGFIYHFLQGFWYRFLVDVRIFEVEKSAKGDLQKIKEILRLEHGVEL